MACHSGGSVEIYIEPLLPARRLLIFGVSPTAQALARLAAVLGYRVEAVDPEAGEALFPDASRLVTSDGSIEPPGSGQDAARCCAVVATLGQRDEEAAWAASRLEPGYLGVVASRKRFGQVRETLAARGATPEQLDRIANPAGLDIGAETPEEIALSILAEITRRGRARSRARAAAPNAAATDSEQHPAPATAVTDIARGPAPAAAVTDTEPDPAPAAAVTDIARGPAPAAAVTDTERDPVCGMTVAAAAASHQADVGGRTWYFCCAHCRDQFVAEPHKYAAAAAPEG